MICSNPACEHSGIDQPPENFPKGKKRCKTCNRERYRNWRKNWDGDKVERYREYRKVIPDTDAEDDLKPIQGNGDWLRITR